MPENKSGPLLPRRRGMPIGWTWCRDADSGSEMPVWFGLEWIRKNDVSEFLRKIQETSLPAA
jgi:hypothetical protein